MFLRVIIALMCFSPLSVCAITYGDGSKNEHDSHSEWYIAKLRDYKNMTNNRDRKDVENARLKKSLQHGGHDVESQPMSRRVGIVHGGGCKAKL